MKRIITIMRNLFFGSFLLLILLIVGSFLNHSLRLSSEKVSFPPPGHMVQANGQWLHIYTEGEGDLTLVFLAGSGTSAPTLDFKALYSRLSDTYSIAVVERAGYGWSDIGTTPRDLTTILTETREALQKVGYMPPYVLFAHSMAGLEALYWSSLYPREVKAIIGLDAAVPQSYTSSKLPSPLVPKLLSFAARSGLTRLHPDICHSAAAIRSGHLTPEEIEVYCALLYRRTLTTNMLDEIKHLSANVQLTARQKIPEVPLFYFISNGVELGRDDWQETIINYVEGAPNGQYQVLEVGHYIHNDAVEFVSTESKAFLSQIFDK